MYKITQKRKIFYAASIIIMLTGIVFIALGGLKLGIDFTGGTMMSLDFSNNRPELSEISNKLNPLNLGNIQLQPIGDKGVTLKLKEINNDQRNEIINRINSDFNGAVEKSFDTIGPTIGNELKNKAMVAVLLVLVGIILYVTWAFRKVSHLRVSSWIFGLNAVIALIHDLIIILGFFAFLGYFFKVEVDVLFVTALLTILGFSVHDTIVVYDRIREMIKRDYTSSFEDIINHSINTTLARSLNTSITTFLVLLALFLFGGESIRYFVLTLIAGIFIGTYSSIFIAAPLLMLFRKK